MCALQEVQLYDVDRQHWHQALQAGADIGGIAIPGPQLVLAAAGRDVLLWRGRLLMRKFRGVCAAAFQGLGFTAVAAVLLSRGPCYPLHLTPVVWCQPAQLTASFPRTASFPAHHASYASAGAPADVQQLSTAGGMVASATLEESAVRVRMIPPLETELRHPATIHITKHNQMHFGKTVLLGTQAVMPMSSWLQHRTLFLATCSCCGQLVCRACNSHIP